MMIIFIAATAGAWYYLLQIRKEPVVISSHTLTPQQLVFALTGATTAAALLMGLFSKKNSFSWLGFGFNV